MKKLALLVGLLTLVAFVSGAMAQGGKPATTGAAAKPAATTAPAPAPAPEAKPEKFNGEVVKVDAMAKSFDVKGKVGKEEKTMTFAVDDKTKVTKGGKDLPLADLKSGMHAQVEYKKDGASNKATAVKVSAPKAGKNK